MEVGRLVGAVALTAGIGLVPHTVAGADPGGEPPAIAAGVVRLGSAPLPGADVIVRLWPDHATLAGLTEEDAVPLRTIGIGRTDLLGRYSFALDPAAVPAAYRDDASGVVDVEVIVANERVQARWSYSVRGDEWALASAPPRTGGRPDTRFNLASGLVWEKVDDPRLWVGGEELTRRAVAGTALGPVTPDVRQLLGEPTARGFDCDTHPGDIHYNRPEKFMWVKGTDSAAVRVTQAIGNEHTLGVALTYSATGAGWSESGSETETFSASATKGGLKGPYYLWDAVNYRDYDNMCAPSYRRPYSYYDLISKVRWAGTARPLKYCTIKRRGYTAATGSAKNVTFANGVDIGPIHVMANAGYDHGVDQQIHFRARRLLCWNNPEGWPKSSKIGAWIPTASYG